jgi:cell division protein FtsI (penicillin-binding protein 3)/stage V sporulation protein D (sporulation-specific penicillin-binding protein)
MTAAAPTDVPPTEAPTSPISPRRIGLLLVALVAAIAIIAGKSLYLQSIQQQQLSRVAVMQQNNAMSIPAVRGEIVDRNGQPLAVGEEALTFDADPKLIKDPVATTERIAQLLHLAQGDKDQLLLRLEKNDTGFQYVARQVPQAQAQKLVDAVSATAKVNGKIVPQYPELTKGLGWYPDEKRLYPLKNVGAQILGNVDVDGNGASALEGTYDNSLKGRPGSEVVVRAPGGTPLDVLSLQKEVDGRNVHLTIDATIQTQAERVLTQTMKAYHAQGATAIVMNPRTGEILAMASVPGIDANKYGSSNPSWQRVRAITDTYEPGSTFKVVTLSAALSEGLVTPTTSFVLPPVLQVADRKIHDAESRGTERMTVKDILVRSSNIGTITIALELGRKRLSQWISKFGFGKPTGIDLRAKDSQGHEVPVEVPGLVLPPDKWSGSTIGNVPIGQGIGVTAMQLAQAYATIANDGVMIQPHLLKSVDGETPPSYPSHRVLSASVARTMRAMFGAVVTDEHGTGHKASIPGYAVAGKTGTANIAQNGVYVKGKYTASFVGMVPAQNPQLLTLVVVDQPDVPWGGSVAAPAFEQITGFALQYLAIPPDGMM